MTAAAGAVATHWLEDGPLRLGAIPRGGRLTWLSVDGGPNLLWANPPEAQARLAAAGQWRNPGGDKFWPSQQCQWPFIHGSMEIPAIGSDDADWEIAATGGELRFRGPFVPALGARLERRARLDGAARALTVVNAIAREEASPFPVHCWNVTQIPVPARLGLALAPYPGQPAHRVFPQMPLRGWRRLAGQGLTLEQMRERFQAMREAARAELAASLTAATDGRSLVCEPGALTGNHKLGAFGTAVWAEAAGLRLRQEVKLETGACYPDGANLELFLGIGREEGPYCELECLSPNVHLRPGERLEQTVVTTIERTA